MSVCVECENVFIEDEIAPGSRHTTYHVVFKRYLVSFCCRSSPLFSTNPDHLFTAACIGVDLSPCYKWLTTSMDTDSVNLRWAPFTVSHYVLQTRYYFLFYLRCLYSVRLVSAGRIDCTPNSLEKIGISELPPLSTPIWPLTGRCGRRHLRHFPMQGLFSLITCRVVIYLRRTTREWLLVRGSLWGSIFTFWHTL